MELKEKIARSYYDPLTTITQFLSNPVRTDVAVAYFHLLKEEPGNETRDIFRWLSGSDLNPYAWGIASKQNGKWSISFK